MQSNAENPLDGQMSKRLIGDSNVSLETCIILPTKGEAGRNEIFFFPGIEGFASVFRDLAPKIAAPATCLQLHTRDNIQSIASITDQLLPHVLERSKDRRDFTLVGYSFGSLIAIELARRLEERGMEGRLVLIDGSPETVKRMLENYSISDDEEIVRTRVLLYTMNILSSVQVFNLREALKKCRKWEDKVEAFAELCLRTLGNISKENYKIFGKSMYNRFKALFAFDYAEMLPIKARIILLKPTTTFIQCNKEDYGLSKVTKNKVEVYVVPGNHITILDDDKVARAINGDEIEGAKVFNTEI